jgi:thiosulfate dehydrogenase [quinone] large subunit
MKKGGCFMFVQMLRQNVYVAYLLTFLRLYIGWQWFQAGFGKVSGGNFDASGFIKAAIKKASGERPQVQEWWAAFLKNFALPNVDVFNFFVPWGEVLVGLALLVGSFTTFAILMGMIMNFSYLFSGAVSSNPQMIIIAMLILVSGYNAGRIGVDRWIIPKLEKPFKKEQGLSA